MASPIPPPRSLTSVSPSAGSFTQGLDSSPPRNAGQEPGVDVDDVSIDDHLDDAVAEERARVEALHLGLRRCVEDAAHVDRDARPIAGEVEGARAGDRETAGSLFGGGDGEPQLVPSALDRCCAVRRLGEELRRRRGLDDGDIATAAAAARGGTEKSGRDGHENNEWLTGHERSPCERARCSGKPVAA